MDRIKEARGEWIRFRRKKLDPEKPKEVGRAKQTEAWIPTLSRPIDGSDNSCDLVS